MVIHLKRLEVDGGYLDNLAIEFSSGLNVLVGARGSGKTSVIEVLRYCLGIPATVDRIQDRADRQALWVLGSEGCATLTIDVDGTERVLRRGLRQEGAVSVPGSGVLFLSQKEIEAIGQDAPSRRRILDAAVGDPIREGDRSALEAKVEESARALHVQRSEHDEVVERLSGLEGVPEQLKAAEGEQRSKKTESAELTKLQQASSALSDELGELVTIAEALAAAAGRTQAWRYDLSAVINDEPNRGRLPDDAAAEVNEAYVAAREGMEKAAGHLERAERALESKREDASKRVNAKRRELAELNVRIEALEEGAGKISRQISALREQDKLRVDLAERKDRLEERIQELVDGRAKALEKLAEQVDKRYEQRRVTAEKLNEQFSPEIRVDVIKAGEVSSYETALGEALQGSNLQWRALAERVSARMSPRELVVAVENLDAKSVEVAAAISESRAKRLVSYLAGVDTTDIVLAGIDEEVEFSLLDGKKEKKTEDLSLGQRCTVVLPLVLARDPDLAVLDQPEDHLDNAFIVETVVQELRDRREGAQRLIATHNANIPVLGEADRVFVLDSSGTEAFVADDGELDDPTIRDSITRLMEGGADAFEKRAAFYGTK